MARAIAALLRGQGGGSLPPGRPERLSRYELGRRVASVLGLDPAAIEAVTQAGLRGAPRPADVSLDSARARDELGFAPRPLDPGSAPGGPRPACIIPRVSESLEDHLRRATRNFTAARFRKTRSSPWAVDLARELARAHGETPPRFPDLEPASIPMVDGRPRLAGGGPAGSERRGPLRPRRAAAWRSPPARAAGRELAPRRPAGSGRPARCGAAPCSRGLASPRADGYATAAAGRVALERALAPRARRLPRPGRSFAEAPRGRAPPPPRRSGLPSSSRPGRRRWAPSSLPRSSPPISSSRAPPTAGCCSSTATSGPQLHDAKVASALESSPALAGPAPCSWAPTTGELLAVDVRRRPRSSTA